MIKRIFITGISPLSLSGVGSAFNVARNLSFHRELAGLCGLTSSDLEAALREIREADKHDDDDEYEYDEDDKHDKNDEDDKPDKHKHLSEMTKCFNGYHFCNYEKVETVYNTETCLAYLQSVIDGGNEETKDPPNSEIAEEFLKKFATSSSVIEDFETALKRKNGGFAPLKYDELSGCPN
jgi:hypothetical protein